MMELSRLAELLLVLQLMAVGGAPDAAATTRTCEYFPPTAVYEQSRGGLEIQDGHQLILIPAGNVRQARDPTETRYRVCEGGGQPALVFMPRAVANGSSRLHY